MHRSPIRSLARAHPLVHLLYSCFPNFFQTPNKLSPNYPFHTISVPPSSASETQFLNQLTTASTRETVVIKFSGVSRDKGRASLSRTHDRAHMVARQCSLGLLRRVSDGISGPQETCSDVPRLFRAAYTHEIAIRRNDAARLMSARRETENFSMEITWPAVKYAS